MVPDVVGDSETDADSAITSAGLTASYTYQNSEKVAADYVISQNPTGGTSVPIGSTVSLTISLGPAMVAVPDVVGDSESLAVLAVEHANLAVSHTYQHSHNVPEGHVIGQDPAGETLVSEGSLVDLTISLGPEMVVVPNFVGWLGEDAGAAINLPADLNFSYAIEICENVHVETVIDQDPAGGTSVPIGSVVLLTISRSEAPENFVVVPDLVGLTLDELHGMEIWRVFSTGVGDFGIDLVYEYSNTVQPNVVISQDPAAGTSYHPFLVTLTVTPDPSQPDTSTQLPDTEPNPNIVQNEGVTGYSAYVAAQVLFERGLEVSYTYQRSETVAAGRVISQYPDPQDFGLLFRGFVVRLTISTGPSGLAVVPDVVGQRWQVAGSAITSVGLAVSYTYQYIDSDDPIYPGRVISQDPAAGTEVFTGSVVTLTVSLGPDGS